MINLVGRNIQSLQQKDLGTGVNVKHLDVSYNKLRKGTQFNPFVNLVTLVIDDNAFTSLDGFPIFKDLQTFSANKNQFADLQGFLVDAHDKFGNLKNLSLLKNPLNPFFQGQAKYSIYRDRVLAKFPKLKTLDGCAVKLIKKQKAQQLKQQDQKYQKLDGVAVFDQKYASQQVKSVKTKSQGNRFLKNNQL